MATLTKSCTQNETQLYFNMVSMLVINTVMGLNITNEKLSGVKHIINFNFF